VRYIRYIRSVRSPRSLYSTSCNSYYHSSSHGSTGSILDRALINQLASSDSSPSSRSIVLKASVTTTFRTLTIKEATSISVELANKAYIHLLTALELTIESITEPHTETDLFAYSMAIATALRYTLTVFIGIIINTGASRKSIASYG